MTLRRIEFRLGGRCRRRACDLRHRHRHRRLGRIPAGYNNIVGVKPTLGRVSSRGVVPNCRTLDTVSVLALTCADGAEVLRLVSDFDPNDPFSRARPPGGARKRLTGWGLKGLAIGVARAKDREFFGDQAAERLFESAIARVGALGGTLVEIDFADFLEAGRMMFDGPWVAERVAALAGFLPVHRDDLLPVTRGIFEIANRWSAADAFQHLYRLRSLNQNRSDCLVRLNRAVAIGQSGCLASFTAAS